MNLFLKSLLPLTAVACAGAQAPAAPLTAPTNPITETSRVARFVPGPGDRPQGFVLRNGTFVTLSPGLAQRLPDSLRKNASLQVAGNEFTYDGSKAIEAKTITIAGISYNDDMPGALPGGPGPMGQTDPARGPGVNPLPPPPPPPAPGGPPPPPGGRGVPAPPPPAVPGAPPPPPPCGVPAPPPPPAEGVHAPAPGGAVPPPPAGGAAPTAAAPAPADAPTNPPTL